MSCGVVNVQRGNVVQLHGLVDMSQVRPTVGQHVMTRGICIGRCRGHVDEANCLLSSSMLGDARGDGVHHELL